MKRLIGMAAAGILLASGALAQSVGYECKVTGSSTYNNWLPNVLFIGHDPAKKSVVVSDPVILHFNDRKPLAGRVAVDNKARITFAWDVVAKDRSGQRTTMKYRATYLKASGKLSISAKPLGYENNFVGGGRCEKKPIK